MGTQVTNAHGWVHHPCAMAMRVLGSAFRVARRIEPYATVLSEQRGTGAPSFIALPVSLWTATQIAQVGLFQVSGRVSRFAVSSSGEPPLPTILGTHRGGTALGEHVAQMLELTPVDGDIEDLLAGVAGLRPASANVTEPIFVLTPTLAASSESVEFDGNMFEANRKAIRRLAGHLVS